MVDTDVDDALDDALAVGNLARIDPVDEDEDEAAELVALVDALDEADVAVTLKLIERSALPLTEISTRYFPGGNLPALGSNEKSILREPSAVIAYSPILVLGAATPPVSIAIHVALTDVFAGAFVRVTTAW